MVHTKGTQLFLCGSGRQAQKRRAPAPAPAPGYSRNFGQGRNNSNNVSNNSAPQFRSASLPGLPRITSHLRLAGPPGGGFP